MYRSVLIGLGGRGITHANAYAHVRNAQLVAGADLDPQRRERFRARPGVTAVYDDFRRMIAQERPDIVHVATNPDVRVEPVRLAAQHGARAVVLEKPMALRLSEAEEIERIAKSAGLKLVVNTQRRYFDTWGELLRVAHGEAGEVRWVRVNCLPAVFCAGAHMIDLVQSLLRDADPVAVWYGAHEYHSSHPGPSSFLTSVTYPRRVQVLWEASQDGVGVHGASSYWMNEEIDVRTERGRVWWTEANGWGYQLDAAPVPRTFPTSFVEEDPPGQVKFTQALIDWLDGGAPHGNRLENAVRVFRIMAAMVQSATVGRRIDFDPATLRDTYDELRQKLEAAEGVHPERQKWDWNRPRE